MYIPTISTNTSLRTRSLHETLKIAIPIGQSMGITRVTDITRLDRIGIPVFVSIRPTAEVGSLCVNAGKGLSPEEARVGAWMEAIEYAFAEPGVAPIPLVQATAQDILDGRQRPGAILDLCPYRDHEIGFDEPMECVWAENVLTARSTLVPAERVFVPSPPNRLGPSHFGYSTCGLASGNTLQEATVHAVLEAIEHDIASFQLINDAALEVRLTSLPQPLTNVVESIRRAGIDVKLLYRPNDFGLPYFESIITDRETDDWKYCNSGFGCHPHRYIAAMRALCEAAQSRLSFIHGGRDDLTSWETYHQQLPAGGSHPANITRSHISYETIPDNVIQTPDINSCWNLVVERLKACGLHHILRVPFTAPSDPLQVVKIIVPGLEEFDSFMPRIGPRLADYAGQS